MDHKKPLKKCVIELRGALMRIPKAIKVESPEYASFLGLRYKLNYWFKLVHTH